MFVREPQRSASPCPRSAAARPTLWILVPSFMTLALGLGRQGGTPDPSGHTAIEQALIEHACVAARAVGVPDTDASQECLTAQLLLLRADFGRDLSRLSNAERKTLDSVCSKIRTARGREAYVECLSTELAAIRSRRKSTGPAPSLSPPPVSAPSASVEPTALQGSSRSSGIWIGSGLAIACAAVGGVLLALKIRRSRRKCRVCGRVVADLGDLCQACRHDAAKDVRRAASERADQERAQEEEEQRKRDRVEKLARQQARQEEDARLRQDENARQRAEQARQREDADVLEREEEARRASQAAVASQPPFDPHAVLGVARDASKEDIHAAYQAGKTKYDPDHVAHLSSELQEHYKTKAQAVERAYQMLTEGA